MPKVRGCGRPVNALYNVCVCSTMGVLSTVGESHEYRGGYLEYRGGYHDKCGDILATVGDVQYRGGYLEYHGGCSVLWGIS